MIGSCGPSVENNTNKVVGTLGEPAIGENSNQVNKTLSGFWYTIPNETGLMTPIPLTPPNNVQFVILNPVVEWQMVQDATSYILQVSRDIDFTDLIVNYETNLTAYLLENLEYSTYYYWRVKSKNADDESSWSATWNFKTIPLPLGVPNLLSPANNQTFVPINPNFQWTSVQNATSYDIEVYITNSGVIIEKTITVSVTNEAPKAVVSSFYTRKESQGSFDLNSKVSNRSGVSPFLDLWHNSNYEEMESSIVDPPLGLIKYYYKIQDATGCQSNFKRLIVYTTRGKDISQEDIQLSNNFTFAVFSTPNPADKYLELVVLLERNEDITVKISDIVGNTLHTEAISSNSTEVMQQIDVESLASGTYFIYVQTANDIAVHKFVKM